MNSEKLAELKGLAEKATPGPWKLLRPSVGIDSNWHVTDEGDTCVMHCYGFAHAVDSVSQANAAYISAANPTVVLALLTKIKELESQKTALVEVWESSKREKLQEQKRLDWALLNSAYYGAGHLSYVDKIGEVQTLVVPTGRVRETIDVLMGNEEKGNG